MKIIAKKLMLLASAMILGLFVSCEDNINIGDKTQVELSVSGDGIVIEMKGVNVTKEVVITAKEAPKRDIEINLKSSSSKGVLSDKRITLKQGETTVSATIEFQSADFPSGSSEISINVTATTADTNVTFNPAKTVFNIAGEGGAIIPAIFTVEVKETEINATNEDGVAIVTFNLSKPLDRKLKVVCDYLESEDFVGSENLSWNPFPVEIPRGQTTFDLEIRITKGHDGKLPLKFSVEGKDVVNKSEPIEFNIIVIITYTAEISTETEIVNVADEDVVKQVTVSLTVPKSEPVTVNLSISSENISLGVEGELDAKLSKNSVVFAAGETTQVVDVVFPKSVFVMNTLAQVTISISSDNVDVFEEQSKVIFTVSGPSNKMDIKLPYRLSSPVDGVIRFVEGSSESHNITVYFGSVPPISKEVLVSVVVRGEGVTSADYKIEKDLVIEDNGKDAYGRISISVKPSAIGKTFEIIPISNDVTFKTSESLKVMIEEIAWPPITRQKPKPYIAGSWNNYAAVLHGCNINSQKIKVDVYNSSHGGAYHDEYDNIEYDVEVSTGSMTVIFDTNYSTGNDTSDYTNILYADFNNDGKFDGADEKIVLETRRGSKTETFVTNNYVMLIPDNVKGSFVIRLGTYAGKTSHFKDGYFIEPNSTANCQIWDIRCTVVD